MIESCNKVLVSVLLFENSVFEFGGQHDSRDLGRFPEFRSADEERDSTAFDLNDLELLSVFAKSSKRE